MLIASNPFSVRSERGQEENFTGDLPATQSLRHAVVNSGFLRESDFLNIRDIKKMARMD